MDLAQLQAVHAYIQQLSNLSSALPVTPAPAPMITTNPLLNPTLMAPPNPAPAFDNSLNSLALALLFANQGQPPQPAFQAPPPPPPPPMIAPTPQPYNSTNFQLGDLQSQIEQQSFLARLTQFVANLSQQPELQQQQPIMPSLASVQLGNIYTPPQQQHVFKRPHPPTSHSMMSKSMGPPPLPHKPIIGQQHLKPRISKPSPLLGSHSAFPKPPSMLASSLHQEAQEHRRKRRHPRTLEISRPHPALEISRPHPALEISRPHPALEISRPHPALEVVDAPRIGIFPETPIPKPLTGGEGETSDSDLNAELRKNPKFNPDCPNRHHPDNFPAPNPQALMLERLTTAYILNALGDDAYRSSDPDAKPEEETTGGGDDDSAAEKPNVIKIPISAIHKMIEDCYNDL